MLLAALIAKHSASKLRLVLSLLQLLVFQSMAVYITSFFLSVEPPVFGGRAGSRLYGGHTGIV